MRALTTAIYARCGVGTALHTAIGGRIYKGRAPENAVYPYVVYFLVSDVPENTFTENLERALIQFSLFSSAPSSGEVEDMFGYLKLLYDDAVLTVTGETMLSMERENALLMVEDHATLTGTLQVWHYAVDYAVLVKIG